MLSRKERLIRVCLFVIALLLAMTGCGGSPTAGTAVAPTPGRPFACRPDTQTIRLGDLAWLVATYQDQNPDPNLVAVLDPLWDVSDGNGRGERPFEDQLWSLVILYPQAGTFTVKLTRQGDRTRTSTCQVVVNPRTP